jgi:hypothetical protein
MTLERNCYYKQCSFVQLPKVFIRLVTAEATLMLYICCKACSPHFTAGPGFYSERWSGTSLKPMQFHVVVQTMTLMVANILSPLLPLISVENAKSFQRQHFQTSIESVSYLRLHYTNDVLGGYEAMRQMWCLREVYYQPMWNL